MRRELHGYFCEASVGSAANDATDPRRKDGWKKGGWISIGGGDRRNGGCWGGDGGRRRMWGGG